MRAYKPSTAKLALAEANNGYKEGIAIIRAVNKVFRERDESHLFPIRGKFDVTERAIRRVRKMYHDGAEWYSAEDYIAHLEATISEIVNDERNW
jgi:hypothetical protein